MKIITIIQLVAIILVILFTCNQVVIASDAIINADKLTQSTDKPNEGNSGGVHIPFVMPSKEEVLTIKDTDVVIGCANAKNIIIEYSSLGCPHCAEYYKEIFPMIKVKLIDTCKTKYVYRDFPTTRPALKGAALVRCGATDSKTNKIDNQKYFELLRTFFSTQASWAFTSSYEINLTKIASISGLPTEKIQNCLKNDDISSEIVSDAFISVKVLNLSHSPSIFVNGENIGVPNYEKIAELVK
jgi:protein-disulfide isomerase